MAKMIDADSVYYSASFVCNKLSERFFFGSGVKKGENGPETFLSKRVVVL